MELIPVSLKEAQKFIDEHHRHNSAPIGHKFSIGLQENGELIGCCIVGRPVARNLDDGKTAEVTRVCVLEGYKNGNSMLYGAAVRACKAMGYKRVITYTLPEESGASLRGAGFKYDGEGGGCSGWDRPSRPREGPEKYPKGKKIRWKYEI